MGELPWSRQGNARVWGSKHTLPLGPLTTGLSSLQWAPKNFGHLVGCSSQFRPLSSSLLPSLSLFFFSFPQPASRPKMGSKIFQTFSLGATQPASPPNGIPKFGHSNLSLQQGSAITTKSGQPFFFLPRVRFCEGECEKKIGKSLARFLYFSTKNPPPSPLFIGFLNFSKLLKSPWTRN